MTSKKKNDNPNLLKQNALILSFAFNILLLAMFSALYVPTLIPTPIPPTWTPGTPDPFELTATQLIKTATEGALVRMGITATPSSTFAPVPTLSGEYETALREQFLNELQTELGFLHPELEESVDIYILSIRSEIERYNETGYGITEFPEKFIQDIDRTSFENVEYVAVIIPSDRITAVGQGFIFKITGDSTELLAQSDLATTLEGFDDRNQNGFPDVAFRWNNCGNHCYGMTLYEIRSDSEFNNLTENLNARIGGTVDLNGDGVLELQGEQNPFIPEGVGMRGYYARPIARWFFWNGEEYEPFPTFEGE